MSGSQRWIANALVLGGIGAMVCGAWSIAPWLGLVTAGLWAFAVGVALIRGKESQ